ncbi:P-loop containing nucleoside triphosphate hydrolase protein [Basidiobolus meristosporus CBS 931.73]|uniref:RNA helicase n=1 Tax=Basidiobolus meristosporus CBS 931.73 TaxID=1314790 RepID=A0A1Y1Z7L0_9FUNG|nr:P-loop containing nucleoside triphosphate hydrolase protein [Basidiobolus meristosporus CBS 931.73]|eukprot:ORY06094.1 P-loop containing nucleoside triphosphate hydrolase protein [Basidiobolus meristosporus CBS 931.73]
MGRNDRSRSRSRSPSPSSKRRRHSHRSSSRRSDRDRSKERDRSRERDRKKGKSRDKHRRNKSRERSRKDRRDGSTERSRERSRKDRRDGSTERSRDRSHRDRRERSTDRSRERSHKEKRDRSRDRSADGSRSRRHRSSRHSRSEKSRTRSKERSLSRESNSDSHSIATSEAKPHTELPTVVEEKAEKGTDQSDEVKQMMLEQEEKVRQRRERVEQWRKEREAKKASEETGDDQSSAPLENQPEAKKWSLEDEDEDEDEEVEKANGMDVDPQDEEAKQSEPGSAAKEAENEKETKKDEDEDEDEIDPLDAFMMDVTAEVQKLSKEDQKKAKMADSKQSKKADFFSQNNNDNSDSESSDSEPEDILALAAKKLKKKDIAAVDHSQMNYEPFRKDFYIEPPELADMTPEQVDILRVELDGIKIRGVNCPKPIKKWTHCGLPSGCHEIIKKLKFEAPTPIQAQAMPAIMSGRDVIGVAKTGSGKTIAFLLPMFRHIKDQRPLEPMEGPIAVIMTPTRELAVQIHRECKHFLKALNLRAVCAYGGSPIKDQIADLKRGAEIVVCTPGRMIDLLSANSGRVTNLRRATYLVLDEADRMFDMGFEPQVMKIVNNVRPSRQTVLFSATFPRQMEALARKILKKPLEITVGGRSVVCEDVTQIVEIREDSTKFLRLLEILGQYYRDDTDLRCLIFVDRQEAADNLLRDLIRKGYPCMSLHGGKDQSDRDTTIADFKAGVVNILIATSVAARGLDVKKLNLVVNYECPNHMEDYVHRVGRTGRAGNKGTAYTFITPEQDRYAVDILKALKLSGLEIPDDLRSLAEEFQEKVKAGSAQYSGSGFGGKGLERLDKERDMVKRVQRKTYGADDDDNVSEEEGEDGESKKSAEAKAAGEKGAGGGLRNAQNATENGNAAGGSGLARARDIIADINARFKDGAISSQKSLPDGTASAAPAFSYEIEINDYPQKARWKVTNKEQISRISELSGAAITNRGRHIKAGETPKPGERKLYLFIEGENEIVVDKAKNEIKRILTEATLAAIESESRGGFGGSSLGSSGKYSVV